jgi:hypothetical protein
MGKRPYTISCRLLLWEHTTPMANLWRDIRTGIDTFLRTPGATAVTLSTLVLGMGQVTCSFAASISLL